MLYGAPLHGMLVSIVEKQNKLFIMFLNGVKSSSPSSLSTPSETATKRTSYCEKNSSVSLPTSMYCGDHFLKAGALHGGAGDTVIHEKDGVRIALVLGGLLKYLPLILDAVGLGVHIIITAQPTVEGGVPSL